MSRKTRIFRIFYTSLFSALAFALFVLTLITPGDIIYQSHTNHRLANIFVISGVYIVTLLLAALIYATRIFTNRSVLSAIPKAWIPVERQDVPKSVRRLVVEGLERSAIIAYQTRPRDRTDEDTNALEPSMTIPKTGTPHWGHIEHPGWTAPDCPDLPSQEFEPVIDELPHLIEAKAVSLAPADPRFDDFDQSSDPSHHQNIPDERVVEVLQRPRNMCLRDYVNHLTRLNLVNPPDLGRSFIRLYERSRFSENPLTEAEFRSLMGMFAELLRGMKHLDPEILAEIQAEDFPEDTEASSVGSVLVGKGKGVVTSGSSFASSNRSGRSRVSRYHPSNSSVNGSLILHRSGTRTPSGRSLRTMRSNLTGSSGGSVVRRVGSQSSVVHHT